MSEYWDALKRRTAKIHDLPPDALITDHDGGTWARTDLTHWRRESDGQEADSLEIAQVAHMVHYKKDGTDQ